MTENINGISTIKDTLFCLIGYDTTLLNQLCQCLLHINFHFIKRTQLIDLKEKGKLQNMDISYCLFCLVLCSPCWDLLKWSYYHCYGALVSNKVLRREDDIPVFSAKGCSFETDAPKLSSKIRCETTLNLSTVCWSLHTII